MTNDIKNIQRQVERITENAVEEVRRHVSARVMSIESFTDDIVGFLEDLEDTTLNKHVRDDIEMAVQGIRDQLNQLI